MNDPVFGDIRRVLNEAGEVIGLEEWQGERWVLFTENPEKQDAALYGFEKDDQNK